MANYNSANLGFEDKLWGQPINYGAYGPLRIQARDLVIQQAELSAVELMEVNKV